MTPVQDRNGKCKAVLTRGRYTRLCSRNAKRNGYCAFHDNRPELRAASYVDCGECPRISTGCKDRCSKATP